MSFKIYELCCDKVDVNVTTRLSQILSPLPRIRLIERNAFVISKAKKKKSVFNLYDNDCVDYKQKRRYLNACAIYFFYCRHALHKFPLSKVSPSSGKKWKLR